MLTYQCDIQMSSAELWVQKFENATNSFHSIYYKFAPPEEERLGKKRSRTEWQIPISQYDSAQHLSKSITTAKQIILVIWRRGLMKTCEHRLDAFLFPLVPPIISHFFTCYIHKIHVQIRLVLAYTLFHQ